METLDRQSDPSSLLGCSKGRDRESCLLFKLTATLDEAASLADIQEKALINLMSITEAEGGYLFMFGENGPPQVVGASRVNEVVGEAGLAESEGRLRAIDRFQILAPEDETVSILGLSCESCRWGLFPIRGRDGLLGVALLRLPMQPSSLPVEGTAFCSYLSRTVGRAIEHARLERQVLESERRYRRIFEQSKDVLYETTRGGGFADINQAGVEMFQFSSREELLTHGSIASLYARPHDRDVFMHTIERQGFVKDYETTFVTKYGEPVEVSITGNVHRDGAGEVIGYEGIMRDITPYKTLMKKLSQSEAKYRAMVEHSTDGIGIFGSRGFLFVNRAFLEMFGYREQDELVEVDVLHLIEEESRRSFLSVLHEQYEPEDIQGVFEGTALRKDGSQFRVEVRSFPLEFRNELTHQLMFRDITDKKRLEEQLIQSERLAAAGKLAFDIAHEINNPLGGIITYTHLVLEDLPENHPVRRNVEKTLKLANRCTIIVKGLLDFARDESDEKEGVDVNTLIKETFFLMEGHMILRKIGISLNLAERIPIIWAVKVKLEQVFLNIIVNAAEAMENNGRLTVSTMYDPETRRVKVLFADTGHGIEQQNMKKIFEPFFTTKQRGRGTGLGLSLSHGIVKQHHGSIRVESLPGQGTTFIVELPVNEG